MVSVVVAITTILNIRRKRFYFVFNIFLILTLSACGSTSDDGGGGGGESEAVSYSCYDAPDTNYCTDSENPKACGYDGEDRPVCRPSSCNFYCSTTDRCYETEDEVIAVCGDDACYTCGYGEEDPAIITDCIDDYETCAHACPNTDLNCGIGCYAEYTQCVADNL